MVKGDNYKTILPFYYEEGKAKGRHEFSVKFWGAEENVWNSHN